MNPIHIDRAGWPFVAGAVLLGGGLAALAGPVASAPGVALALFFLYFFRDPDRVVQAAESDVLSPADGRVVVAGPALPDAAPPGEWLQVSIFLSPMDVHINRVPASGVVTKVTYKAGKFLPAYRHDAGSTNERSEIWVDHGGQPVVARQIVGFLARRVVCRLKAGATVRAGDRFGLMKFGSRMDVFVPTSSTIRVTVDQVVRAGETVIAVLH